MISLLLLATAVAATPFEKRFGEGGAEISAYTLSQPRYGERRKGEAVMIWVTEPFSKSKLVKLDDPSKTPNDAVTVLKLNLVKKFTTGVYDYSLMTSVFVPTTEPMSNPLKVSFSSQEWCGNTFHQLEKKGVGYRSEWHSYFESEGDRINAFELPPNGVLDDELFFRVRELIEPLPPGNRPFIPALETLRLSHADPIPGFVDITKGGKTEKVKVPAGTFETTRFDFKIVWGGGSQQQQRSIWVEKALPHRIIAWEGDVPGFKGNESTRERGELKGSIRDEYWKHNRVIDEPLRKKLNLLP